MKLRPRPSFTSPLARFRRCSCLSIIFWEGEEAGAHDVIQHPALLASLYMAGVGADVARNITELRLEGPLELPTLVTVALVLAGTLRHVRILALDTQLCGMGSYSFNNMHALHTTLRAAFPALEELNLPARACLRGLEAFAGSHLHTVRVMAESPGSLRMSHVRSLVQLPQLLQLDLDGGDWDACWSGDSDDDVWDDEKADSPAGAAELPLGDASDEETFREMEEEQVWDLWALRRLLVSPPPALERLRWLAEPRQEVGFAGGRIACVDLHGGADGPDLHRAAATLLPALAATGRRLPLLKVNYLVGYPADVISQLQPHTPFSRLLAATDRVELGHLSMVDGTAAEAAAALQAVVRAVGGMPEELQYGRHGHWRLSLQTQPRYSGGAGGHSQAAGSAATAAAPAAVMLAEVTAQQVLERAAARMWDTAEAEAAAAMARAEAAEAAYVAENSWHRREELARMYILLRGPFVWQRTCGPDGAASGGGAARLKEWLESLVARSPPPATAAAAAVAPGSPAGTAAAAEAPGEVKVRRCSFAACGSGSAVAVVWCDDPIAALQLYRAAAAAAAGEAPGCLQVSVCKEGADEDWTPVIHAVIRELWDDHLGSAPVMAMPTGTAAAAGQGLAARGAPEAGGVSAGQGGVAARRDGAAVGQCRAAVGRDEAMALECDLQVLQRLLLLAEQALKAVGKLQMDSSQLAGLWACEA
ncbi:hypothetical protein CHLRE_14g608900v5 [Chlamydomonas reinhardtii]|uniref:Uncharacterized protein n=1 Tax=Chlamydomonas reinhardtii TaxID=3055 RepID=A0A2K3CX56_CHLRE|nr:uncharacterized protein CHLRE_14g608900v5 [Chlamydomonas reinhardtii]PNW72850.1 hypothetical protein CHLRE_14g608900v5 [Chlamydomonas reinhardtii]